MSEKYSLVWETFDDHTKNLFQKLLTTSDFADVTLVSDDQIKFKTHRFVLTSCSTVFKNILELDSAQSIIFLRGIQSDMIRLILEYMYSGKVYIPKEKMEEFLIVAKSLQVKEIIDVEENDKNDYKKANDEEENLQVWKFSEYSEKSKSGPKNHCNSKHKEIKQSPEECGQLLTSIGGVSSQEKHVHENSMICSKCDFQTKKQISLHQHLRNNQDQLKDLNNIGTYYKHTVNNSIQRPCQVCPKDFGKSSDLNRYVQEKHEKVTQIQPKSDLRPKYCKGTNEVSKNETLVKITNRLFD